MNIWNDRGVKGLARNITITMTFGCLVSSGFGQTSSVTVSGKEDRIPRGIPNLTIVPMKFRDRTAYYARHSFDAGSLISPVLPAAIFMASPPKRYPREWRDGAEAFGRNFGNALASETAANSGKYLAASLLREDPRYYPDTRTNAFHRVMHALVFTIVDRSAEGKPRLAVSNLAGSLAGGFVGRAYLPAPYADNTHALQRSGGILGGYVGTQLVGYATGNLVEEFQPELKRLARKLHLPFVK